MDANIPMGGSPTPTTPTPPTPPTPTPSEPTPTTSDSSSYADGGETSSSDKIQWFAIGIFALTMISLAYKSIYYNRAIKNIGKTNNDSSAKLAELEKNVRAIRGDKYESSN